MGTFGKPCIICCRLSDKRDLQKERGNSSHKYDGREGGGGGTLKRCFQLLGRYLDNDDETTVGGGGAFPWSPFETLIDAGMSFCEDCSKVVESFCQLYDQLKSIELLVNWKVRTLRDRMSKAEKIPVRIKAFRECAKRLKMGGDVDPEEAFNLVFKLKTDLVKKCSRKLRKALPRLTLKRCQMPPNLKPEVKLDPAVEPLEDDDAMDDFEINYGNTNTHSGGVYFEMNDPLGFNEAPDCLEDPLLENHEDDGDWHPDNQAEATTENQRLSSSKTSVALITSIDPLTGKFRCNLCGKLFGHQSNLYTHRNRRNCAGRRNNKAPFQIKSSSSKKSKVAPPTSTQTGEVSCNLCGELFGHRLTMYNHRKKCEGTGVPPSLNEESLKCICTICGKEFSENGLTLKEHQRQSHFPSNDLNVEELGDGDLSKMGNANLAKSSKAVVTPEQKGGTHRKKCVRKMKDSPSKIKRTAIAPLSNRDPLTGKFSCDHCGQMFRHRPNLYPHRKRCILKKTNIKSSSKISVSSSRDRPTPTAKVSCNLCGKTFGHSSTMYKHRKKCEGTRVPPPEESTQFLCVICLKEFSENGLLQEHQRKLHFPSNDLNVDELDEDLHMKKTMQVPNESWRRDPATGKFSCPHCTKAFKQCSDLKIHVAQVHTKVRDSLCSLCGKGFVLRTQLRKHMKTVHSELKMQSEKVGAVDGEAIEMEQSELDEGPRSIEENYQRTPVQEDTVDPQPPPNPDVEAAEKVADKVADEDDSSYIITTTAESEDSGKPRSIFNPETGKHKCQECRSEFTFLDIFQAHYQKCHQVKVRYKCAVCEKDFKGLRNAKLHYQNVHKKVRYPCPKCYKVFTLPSSLRTHQLMTDCWKGVITKPSAREEEEGEFKCQDCGKEFTVLSRFKKHLNMAHHQSTEAEREHLCSQCGRRFAEFNYLHNHIKSAHSELREQVCHLCGMGFKLKCHLGNHLRKTHGLEKNS